MFIYNDTTLNDTINTTRDEKVKNNTSKSKKHGRQRIENRVKGNYVYTYLIDSNGKEMLLKKVPVFKDMLELNLNKRINSTGFANNIGLEHKNISDFNKNEMLMRSALFNMNIRRLL